MQTLAVFGPWAGADQPLMKYSEVFLVPPSSGVMASFSLPSPQLKFQEWIPLACFCLSVFLGFM